ncbi:hypothetical protein HY523_00560 [Candidatus Berkelbacteria bacterium]|nr:hypothetical protein [Candidatus Berkelbacteria bacterium]
MRRTFRLMILVIGGFLVSAALATVESVLSASERIYRGSFVAPTIMLSQPASGEADLTLEFDARIQHSPPPGFSEIFPPQQAEQS